MGLLKCGLVRINFFCSCHDISAILSFNSVESQRPATIQMNSIRQGDWIAAEIWLIILYKILGFNLGKLIWIKILRNCKVQWTYWVSILCAFISREHCKCHLHGFVNVPGLEEVIQFSLSFYHTQSIGWCNLMRQRFTVLNLKSSLCAL